MADADFRVDAEGMGSRIRRALKLIEAWIRAHNDGGGSCICVPPVPDPTKDYVFVYDSSDETYKWVLTTTDCPE